MNEILAEHDMGKITKADRLQAAKLLNAFYLEAAKMAVDIGSVSNRTQLGWIKSNPEMARAFMIAEATKLLEFAKGL